MTQKSANSKCLKFGGGGGGGGRRMGGRGPA